MINNEEIAGYINKLLKNNSSMVNKNLSIIDKMMKHIPEDQREGLEKLTKEVREVAKDLNKGKLVDLADRVSKYGG